MAVGQGKEDKLRPWHYELEKYVEANAILGLFIHAVQLGEYISFSDELLLERAKKLQKDIKKYKICGPNEVGRT